jgi:hypothetical protein
MGIHNCHHISAIHANSSTVSGISVESCLIVSCRSEISSSVPFTVLFTLVNADSNDIATSIVSLSALAAAEKARLTAHTAVQNHNILDATHFTD